MFLLLTLFYAFRSSSSTALSTVCWADEGLLQNFDLCHVLWNSLWRDASPSSLCTRLGIFTRPWWRVSPMEPTTPTLPLDGLTDATTLTGSRLFLYHTKRKLGKKLLIVNNLSSHISAEVIELCHRHNIAYTAPIWGCGVAQIGCGVAQIRVRCGSDRVRCGSVRVRCGSDSSAPACCTASPGSNLGSAPQRRPSTERKAMRTTRVVLYE